MASHRVLVYGGKGALGCTIVKYFRSKDWWVGSIDLFPNEEASANVLVDPKDSWVEQNQKISAQVEELLGDDKVDSILCVAGGWAGGNAKSKDLVKNADLMFKQSAWTSVIAAQLASKFLKEGGMLQLTGAQPALSGTAGCMGYGMAKAAVHQLIKSLVSKNNGLPENVCVAAILPVTLDTPMNRKFMQDADTSTWTPLETVAGLLHSWSANTDRPATGSLVQIFTKDNKTTYKPVDQ